MSKDKTLSQRQAAHTARLVAEGGRRVTVRIPPELNARLDAELEKSGKSANALILMLLQNYLGK